MLQFSFASVLWAALTLAPAEAGSVPAADAADYLGAVRAYADSLLAQGRDTYGPERSPLIAAALDRQRMQPGSFPPIEGIRPGDRTLSGANPMHDENLYQILYALTRATGEARYVEEADRTLKYFFEHCQSPGTGLMAWGEHLGWDFTTESVTGPKGADSSHEFFRPWVLWDRWYALAPESAVAFARGLWEHQIHNHETGEFSRHARWSKHGTGGSNEYPRHGGFYIRTWARAYEATRDPVFAQATETLVDMYNRLSSPKTGAIPCSTAPDRVRMMWPASNLSLAVDLTEAGPAFPEALRAKMTEQAGRVDRVFLALPHDFAPKGIGFLVSADIDDLGAFDSEIRSGTEPWVTGYGMSTDAQVANLCLLRLRQLPEGKARESYRDLILRAAGRYLDSSPDLGKTIYPGPLGDAIFHMLAAHELSGDAKYLARAEFFAELGIRVFLTDGSPLPRASSQHEHYEAITRGDTFMMALLRLWQARQRPDLDLGIVYADR